MLKNIITSIEIDVNHAETLSGEYIRTSGYEEYRTNYIIKNAILSKDQLINFSDFFKNRRASKYSFKMKNILNENIKNQIIGKGDGKCSEFQLYKNYISNNNVNDDVSDDVNNTKEDNIYSKKITKPIKESVKLYLSLPSYTSEDFGSDNDEYEYREKTELLINDDFTINDQQGIITLHTPLAKNAKLIADFDFDIEVRFNQNNFEYMIDQNTGAIKLNDIYLTEIL